MIYFSTKNLYSNIQVTSEVTVHLLLYALCYYDRGVRARMEFALKEFTFNT